MLKSFFIGLVTFSIMLLVVAFVARRFKVVSNAVDTTYVPPKAA